MCLVTKSENTAIIITNDEYHVGNEYDDILHNER